MTYKVVYAPDVIAAIEAQVGYLESESVSTEHIHAWLKRLFEFTEGLYTMPKRHPVAVPESAEMKREIRRIVFGNYLLFYHVDGDHGRVNVLRFRHAARIRPPGEPG